jgi:protoporphyrinogen oxidase
MGLAAALELAKKGARVEVLERDDRLGGMSAHFDFAGTRIERYYHFICAPDQTTFEYLRELDLEDKLRWTDTRMGFYLNGQLHDWGNPQAMLRFPGLSLLQKLRYGLHVMRAKSISDWRPYDRLTSTEWVQKWIGKPAYEVMWRSLFHYKFYEFQDSLSAAWLGTRIKRVALSRKSIFQERLGYLDGGSEVLLEAIAARLTQRGGSLSLASPVEAVLTEGAGTTRRVRGILAGGVELAFDAVVSTAPLPHVPALVPDLPDDERAKIDAIRNVGVVCVILKLKRSFTPNFWLNINDPRVQIPGLIEYTNLNPLDGSSIVYAPFYMPHSHPKYQRTNQEFIDETLACLSVIRPDFDRDDVLAATASRYRYAQTVCSPGFLEALPPMRSGLKGFFMADTSYYYPEDRSISESLRTGVRLAHTVWEAL